MLKKITYLIGIIFLIILVSGSLYGWNQYKEYQRIKSERIESMKEKVEEVQVRTGEGETVKQVSLDMEEEGLFTAEDFLEGVENIDLANQPLISAIKPSNATLEGFLFPDTYRFKKQSDVQSVLDKMLDNFTQKVSELGVDKFNDPITIPGYESVVVNQDEPMDLYKVLILASIVEAEGGGKTPGMTIDQERATIAGVFYNRLVIGQALQSDATVNYATGKQRAAATSQDLQINSPYNTYKYPGLPPTPINNPSISSIKAVLNPIKTNFFYFLHLQPSGEVQFSRTFEEHVSKKQ